ncbi:MAG: phosphonate ABC transporter, permease protein PhnE [Alphaproteobacteria bacterium]
MTERMTGRPRDARAAPDSEGRFGAVALRRLLLEGEARHRRSFLKTILIGVLLALLIWSWDGAEMRPLDLILDAGNMVEFAAGFFPPDFHDWEFYLEEMVITVQIAVWGTALAVVFAIPLGLMCSANIAPVWLRQPMRRLMDAARAINEMVFAMLFVVAVGLGPFAGVLALFVHTTGILAKLFSEAVEAIDPRPVEGIRATGANVIEEIVYGVIPQVMPLWISFTLYRFESNVRSATVVGMVGAGGIGVILWESIRGFSFDATAAVMIIIIIVVTLIDLVSSQLRRFLI